MSITKDNVLHVAGLARRDLSQEEVARYEVELNDVLEFMDYFKSISLNVKRNNSVRIKLEDVDEKNQKRTS